MSKVYPTRICENTVNIAISDKVMEDIKKGEEFAVYIGATKVVLKHYKGERLKTILCPICGTKISAEFDHSFMCPICGMYANRDSDGNLRVVGV